jgi:hypothetical protein
MVRRVAMEAVGELDERFFFYAEDFDWCKRFGDAGWNRMFIPEATINHFGGGSSSNAPLRYNVEMMRASALYWKKHHGSPGVVCFYLLATAQHGVRLVARSLLRITGLAKGEESEHKLQEHLVCLRWLVTGKGV